MTRIICDTMIWYGLSKNQLQIPDPSKYTLVCTYLSLMELAFSPNNLNKLSEVQAAIHKIFSLKPEIILQYPWDHAQSLIVENFEREFEIESNLTFAFLRVLLNHPKEGLVSNSFKEELEKISSIRKKNFDGWADFLNDLNNLENDIKRALVKYSGRDLDLFDFKKWFLHKLNEREINQYSIDTIPWEQFEFYTTVGATYLRKMMVSWMKAEGNDENDMSNMIYVQPGDKYWTLEKKWMNLAREAKMNGYLYEPNG
ncbi:hypothetical protein [Algoriphagus algorifonticola]|uniref:hypothetical protein n=1 Tax=Algoriphagus algorifonticola TaxID=2593007 RepID=UPI00119F3BBF|nr:hypothetical protein [Algoriphagus algorifonticola]